MFKGGQWNARLTTAAGRTWVPLGTADEEIAKKKLAALLEGSSKKEEPLDTYADRWIKEREKAGVVMTREEWGYWRLHCLEKLGSVRLCDVTPQHVRDVLDALVKGGLSKQTVKHVKSFLHRLFASAWRADLIPENPVAKVVLPKVRAIKKERVILTDEEFTQFIICEKTDEELKMLSIFSRVLGGMRAGDLHQLVWDALDVGTFAEIAVPRSKTKTPQKLVVPEPLRPFLRSWWEGQGKPGQGPVFPSRRGERKGQAKLPKGSYAKRLRRALKRAGLTRGELFEVRPATLPVDFHSFRRACRQR